MIQVEHLSKTFQVSKRKAAFAKQPKPFFLVKPPPSMRCKTSALPSMKAKWLATSALMVLEKYHHQNHVRDLTPDQGVCHINGRTPWQERIQHVKDIGVVFGQRSQLWWDVPVNDSFDLIRDIYKVDAASYQRNLEELVTLLDLGEILKTPARSLSLGQRMRCEIAASLLHDPKILFLDEPTIGLDAVSKIAVRQFIKKKPRKRYHSHPDDPRYARYRGADTTNSVDRQRANFARWSPR